VAQCLQTAAIPSGSYNGISFAKVSQIAMNKRSSPCSTPVDIVFDNINNNLWIVLTDEQDNTYGELYKL